MNSIAGKRFTNLGQVNSYLADTNSTLLTIRVESTTLFQLNGSYQATHPLVTQPENQLFVTSLNATDQDGDQLSFSIGSVGDGNFFNVNATDGSLSFKSNPDFESNEATGRNHYYEVVVQVSDGESNSSILIPVLLSNVNDPPVFTSSSSVSVPENQTFALDSMPRMRTATKR